MRQTILLMDLAEERAVGSLGLGEGAGMVDIFT